MLIFCKFPIKLLVFGKLFLIFWCFRYILRRGMFFL